MPDNNVEEIDVDEEETRQLEALSEDDIEVLISDSPDEEEVDEEFKGLSKKEIVERLKAAEEKAAKPAQATDMDRLSQTLEKLASRPVQVTAPSPPPPPPKTETVEELKEKYGERFVTDPIAVIMELQEKKNSPINAQSSSGQLILARKLLEMDPKTSQNFAKFSTQIDQLVASASPEARANPMIYEQAYKMILAQNVDTIVAEQVAQKVSEAVDAELKKRGIGEKGSSQPVSHSETRGAPRPAGKTTVKMDPKRAERLAALGIDPRDRILAERKARSR